MNQNIMNILKLIDKKIIVNYIKICKTTINFFVIIKWDYLMFNI